MSNIVITSDSTTDLSLELRERYHIELLPLGVVLGDKLYTDGIDINPDMIYEYHDKTGLLPKTNAVNVETASEFFKKYADEGKTVIHFSLSSEMSSSFNNARIAATEFDNVYVVDTRNLSTGGGLLVIAAAEMAEKGMDAKDIITELERLIPCVDASFVIDDLEYLHKGGRCTAVEMFGANLLKLKPCIQVKDGSMGVLKKYRGKYSEVLKQYVKEKLENADDIIGDHIFVTHAGVDAAIVEEVVALVKATGIFKEVFLTRAGCTISSHCGPDTLGILFIRKSQI